MRLISVMFIAAAAALPCGGAAEAQEASAASDARQPIAGAGNWVLQRRLPGIPGRVCTIRVEGPEANTTILLNNEGIPVMMVGHRDWSGLTGTADVSMSSDGGAPTTVNASMVHNLVLVSLSEAVLERVRGARTLHWSFPHGSFRADVAGLGAALDALAACRPDPAG